MENFEQTVLEEVASPVEMSVKELDDMITTESNSHKELYVGMAIGGAVASAGFGTAWFLEKHNNNKLLKAFERAIGIAVATGNKDEVTINKEVIKIDGNEIEDPMALLREIQLNLDNIKGMSKKKKKRWIEVYSLTIAYTKEYGRRLEEEKQNLRAAMEEMEQTEVIKEAVEQ